ncbi:MAG: Dabb family protein [Pseudomonadales bacterium]|nr:Dabb family protein [Pseudomonadales bacterium]MCP5190275.1 Dabb family protein [Pseudomonadales bacterium]
MIVVQDRIEVDACRLHQLQELFHQRYLEAATARGLEYIDATVSPPVKLTREPVVLSLRWQVADAPAWWAMRAQSMQPAVAAFWNEVDALCHRRERTYLVAADAVSATGPGQDVSGFRIGVRGHRETAQLRLRDGLTTIDIETMTVTLEQAAAQLPGLELSRLSANFAPDYAVGDYTWDLLYPDAGSAAAARDSEAWNAGIMQALERYCTACHALGLETISAGLRRPGLVGGIKRTAYFRLLPGKQDASGRFEADLLEMPEHIPEILNWRLSRAVVLPWNSAQCEPWTYVWEQEFESLDGLTGPYMLHPHHWAQVDRWFDPESGVQTVDANLSHAFCAAPDSILSRECQ